MKLKITYSNYMQLTITRWLIDDYSGAFSNRLTPLLKLEYLSFLGFTRYPPVAMNSTVKDLVRVQSPSTVIEQYRNVIEQYWGICVRDRVTTSLAWARWMGWRLLNGTGCHPFYEAHNTVQHIFLTSSHDFSLELVSWDDHVYLDYAWFWSVFCRELRHWVEARGMQVFGRGPTRANATAMTPGPCGSGPVTMLVLTLIALNT